MNQHKNYLQLRVLTLIFFLSIGTAFSSCHSIYSHQERNVGPFTGIKVGGAFNVVLTQTNRHRVVVEAEEDVIEKVRTEVKGDVLHIDMEWDWSWKGHDEVTVYIDFEDLESLTVSGAGDVKSETPINTDDLDIRVSGAGDVDLEVNAKTMEVVVSGAGDVNVSGSTDRQKIRLSGAGDYKAQHLKSNYTDARASGAGSAVVYVAKEIEARASGAGSVKYYGEPEKERTNASGGGSISRR